MANIAAETTAHPTLTANVVDTVTLSSLSSAVSVINRSSNSEIYCTFDGSTPEVRGPGTRVILPGMTLKKSVGYGSTTVKLKSEAAAAYSVEAD